MRRRPNPRLVLGVALALGLATGLFDVRYLPTTVSTAIARRVAAGPGAVLPLARLAPLEWDRVHVFGPYTPRTAMEAELGIPWPSAARVDDADESRCWLVFTRTRRVVLTVGHPRTKGDCWPFLVGRSYAREDAVFIVRPAQGSGGPHLAPESGRGAGD